MAFEQRKQLRDKNGFLLQVRGREPLEDICLLQIGCLGHDCNIRPGGANVNAVLK